MIRKESEDEIYVNLQCAKCGQWNGEFQDLEA
jgi:hypothetical protein